MKVWSAPPGHGLVKRSLAIHRAFYRMMGGMLDEIEREHGRFVLLDIHSYNYRRDGPDGDPAPQDRSEERRVGKECVRRVEHGGRRIMTKKNKYLIKIKEISNT